MATDESICMSIAMYLVLRCSCGSDHIAQHTHERGAGHIECAGIVDTRDTRAIGQRKRRKARKPRRNLLGRFTRACAEPRRENMRLRFDVHDFRMRVALKRTLEMLPRTVDHHRTAARQPCVEFDADAIAQRMARPLKREETEGGTHFELVE